MQIDLAMKDIANTLLLILPETATKVEDLLARNEVNISFFLCEWKYKNAFENVFIFFHI